MTRKKRRLYLLLACSVGFGSATALTLSAFSDNLVFFVSPSDLVKVEKPGRTVRLGGLVEQGSVTGLFDSALDANRLKHSHLYNVARYRWTKWRRRTLRRHWVRARSRLRISAHRTT